MGERNVITFGRFRLDLQRGCLLCGDQDVHLRRKAWEVLAYLAQRPGVTVAGGELLDALWPDIAVTPNALGTTVWELRRTLSGLDDKREYIQTIPRRGFRFVADSAKPEPAPVDDRAEVGPARSLIGRTGEIGRLLQSWRRALAGERQVVFVGGMPGVGKSTLVAAAVDSIRAASPIGGGIQYAKGQCLSLQGEPEPCLPVLEIVEQLANQSDESAFIELAKHFAPTWLVQLPSLLNAADIAALRHSLVASGAQRMLHDAVRLLERLALQSPLLLVIEDMQWADSTTVDILVALAERAVPSRLLVIATYRPIEVLLAGHPIAPVARTLCARGKALSIDVDGWPLAAVEEYLDRRFANAAITANLAPRIERHTKGNPLFIQEATDHLVRSGQLQQSKGRWTIAAGAQRDDWSLPDEFRKIVDGWLTRQAPRIVEALETASLIEGDFTVQEVATAVAHPEVEVDAVFSELARNSRLIEAVGNGRWPDLTTTQTYKFAHALYQRALADRVAPLRGRALHKAIADRLASGFAKDPGKVAARLAAHFDAAGDQAKHIDYLEIGAAAAVARYAYAEARHSLLAAIDALQQLAPSAASRSREADRWLDYAHLTTIAKGLPHAEVKRAYDAALQAAEEAGDDRLRFRALLGRVSNLGYGGALEQAMEVGVQILELAGRSELKLLPAAHVYVAMNEIARGKVQEAYDRVCRALTMEAEPNVPATWDLELGATVLIANCLALLGRPQEMEAAIERVLRRTRQTTFVLTRVTTFVFVAAIRIWSRQLDEAQAASAQAVAIADEVEIPTYQTVARILYARARREDDPAHFIAEVEEQLRVRDSLGERWWNSLFYNWLAEAYRDAGELDAALTKLEIAESLEEREFYSETLRIRATVFEAQSRIDAAEQCFRDSLEVATHQGTRNFRLQATVALSRLLRRLGRTDEARALLQDVRAECSDSASIHLADAMAELQTLPPS